MTLTFVMAGPTLPSAELFILGYSRLILSLLQFVPLIVDMCTQIVEAKGLEMTGVYRIPGNKAAVTLLQEEFNKVCNLVKKWKDFLLEMYL